MINKIKVGSWRSCERLLLRFLAPVLVLAAFIPTQVSADGLGFTGNLYSQHFVLRPGGTSEGTEVFVIIINTDQTPVNVKITTNAPEGVTLLVPETDFSLDAGAQKRLDVVVKVNAKAILGEYTITLSAQSYRLGTGIQVTGGGSQQAELDIVKGPTNLFPLFGGVVGGFAIVTLFLILIYKHRRYKVSQAKPVRG